jgi:hypothetical protein
VPLAEAGVLQLVDDDLTIMPGVRVRRTGGHCMHHQMVLIESGGKTAAFVADLIPTTAHLSPPWIMGYDLYPMDTLAAKKAFLGEAVEKNMLVFFEHDPPLLRATSERSTGNAGSFRRCPDIHGVDIGIDIGVWGRRSVRQAELTIVKSGKVETPSAIRRAISSARCEEAVAFLARPALVTLMPSESFRDIYGFKVLAWERISSGERGRQPEDR